MERKKDQELGTGCIAGLNGDSLSYLESLVNPDDGPIEGVVDCTSGGPHPVIVL